MLRVCLPCYITDRGYFSLYLEYRFCPQLCASPYFSRHLGSRLESSGTPLNDLLSYVFFLNSFNLQSRFYHFLFKLQGLLRDFVCLSSWPWLLQFDAGWAFKAVQLRLRCQSTNASDEIGIRPFHETETNCWKRIICLIVWRLSEDQVDLLMKRRNIYVATSHRTLF